MLPLLPNMGKLLLFCVVCTGMRLQAQQSGIQSSKFSFLQHIWTVYGAHSA